MFGITQISIGGIRIERNRQYDATWERQRKPHQHAVTAKALVSARARNQDLAVQRARARLDSKFSTLLSFCQARHIFFDNFGCPGVFRCPKCGFRTQFHREKRGNDITIMCNATKKCGWQMQAHESPTSSERAGGQPARTGNFNSW